MSKKAPIAKSEDSPAYKTSAAPASEATRVLESMPTAWIMAYAIDRYEADLPGTQPMMDSPKAVREYLVMKNASKADQFVERFSVLFLNSQNQVICLEEMFAGSLTQTSVYPREVVRAALRHNAAACILSHNHPSGAPQPSRADEALTNTLKAALALVDVRVLDHIIVAGAKSVSMAEMGLV